MGNVLTQVVKNMEINKKEIAALILWRMLFASIFGSGIVIGYNLCENYVLEELDEIILKLEKLNGKEIN